MKETILLRLPSEMKKSLRYLATNYECSVAEICRYAIYQLMTQEGIFLYKPDLQKKSLMGKVNIWEETKKK